MSNHFEEISEKEETHLYFGCSDRIFKNNNRYPRHVLKPKNNYKSRCNKALKNKLKKYKLRRDGLEDPDVIDISQAFYSQLKIKSPQSSTICVTSDVLESYSRPKNYLFNMARRKQKLNDNTLDASTKTQKPLDEVNVSPILEVKKKTNAFKFMMDSRNNSIGGNSAGKEKVADPLEEQILLDKKNLKIKRNVALHKMAEEKGSLKRQMTEQLQEVCIKQKMEERADRLKQLINNSKIKKSKKQFIRNKKHQSNKVHTPNTNINGNDNSNTDDVIEVVKVKNVMKQTKILKLVDMFPKEEISPENKDPKKKEISIEDQEFLDKLSPSIKRKENMLCYFKKIEKPQEPCLKEDVIDLNPEVIKVKMTPRRKNKGKKKKLSLSRHTSNEILKDIGDNSNLNTEETNVQNSVCLVDSDPSLLRNPEDIPSMHERRKRKRKENVLDIVPVQEDIIDNSDNIKEGRPKRHVKKPVKYIDDVELASSNDELHIFTPKKRKQEKKLKTSITKETSTADSIINISDVESKDVQVKHKKRVKDEVKEQNKSIKLAPIFASKPQLTAEELEAKQKFLQSGIPEKLKKTIEQQKKLDKEVENQFPIVVHIQQNTQLENSNKNSHSIYHESVYNEDCIIENVLNDINIKDLLKIPLRQTEDKTFSLVKTNTLDILQSIKTSYPKFPVYRTYRLLKSKSRGEFKELICPDLDNSIEIMNGLTDIINANPDCLAWTDKYKATTSNHLIGNFDTIKEIKKWLTNWTEVEIKPKRNNLDSDSSDFYVSDTDSNDIKVSNNLLVLAGPKGSGKTSSIYAIASELAIKVIEVNASSRRTGKLMLQDLQEATQSHKVNRGNSSAENSQKSQEIIEDNLSKNVKKRGRPKKSDDKSIKIINVHRKEKLPKKKDAVEKRDNYSQSEVTRTGMSLILIDDADIVFDQDDGFTSAIGQLIQISKRPVILITSSVSCLHLQKFMQCGKVLNMQPFLPKMLGTWLDILCLADSGLGRPGLGAKCLDMFSGDIRKSINHLQFYITSEKLKCSLVDERESQNSETYKHNIEDESSSMSWACHEGADTPVNGEEELCDQIFNTQLSTYTLDTFSVWWSVPKLFKETYSRESLTKGNGSKPKIVDELETLANVADTFSVVDYLTSTKLDKTSNIATPLWKSFESDSVSENEHLEYFHKSGELIHELVKTSIVHGQKVLNVEHKTDISFPGMAVFREKDRLISRHENLTSFLNPSTSLDRKALALDYWSTCRTICRIEKNKTDIVCKRNNRFYHHLKSLSSLCKTDCLDKLCNSLQSKGNVDS